MSLLSIPELVDEEIHAWVGREQHVRPGATRRMLMDVLARAIGLANERQVYRYASGEAPFPLEKVLPLCRAIGSWKLLQAVNQAAGLVAEPKPDVGRMDGYDLVAELTRNLRESAEFAAAAAAAAEQVPSEIELRRLEREGREAIQQVDRLISLYRELVTSRSARA